MIIDLRLQQFRSYRDDSFEFGGGVNIIVGPNASGKTNLLEAILVLARGNSYRAKDAELISFEAPWARLDAHINSSVRTVKLETEPAFHKTYELDGKVYRRLTLQHALPIVLFEPNHLSLLHGSPEQRRDYLDDLLEQTMPNYGSLRRQYRRTLAQRNALLKKSHDINSTQLFPWNVRLGELGGMIARARAELTEMLNTQIRDLYRDLSSNAQTRVGIAYQSQFALERYETELVRKLELSAILDGQRGFTGSGPHREDFVVTFDGKPSPETASRGETRTCVLALKIMELLQLEKARDTKPLLLLDDVFSELDGARRRALTEHLKDYQTFITTTDADVVTRHFAEHSNIIAVQKS